MLNCAPRSGARGRGLRCCGTSRRRAAGRREATAAKLVAHFGVDVFAAFDAPDAERRLREVPGRGREDRRGLAGAWGTRAGAGRRAVPRSTASRRRSRSRSPPRTAPDPGARARRPFGALAGIRGATFHRCDALAARWARRRTPRPGWRRPCCACCSRRRWATGVYAPFAKLADGVAGWWARGSSGPLGQARSRRRRTCFCAAGTSPWRRI